MATYYMKYIIINFIVIITFFHSVFALERNNLNNLEKKKLQFLLLEIKHSASILKSHLYNNVNTMNNAYNEIRIFKQHHACNQDFFSKKGKLPWPAKGILKNGYGTFRTDTHRWNGIYVITVSTTVVRAPHCGSVIFAEKIKGFGFLLIIKHPGDYMTLYGNNEILFKEKGEAVQTGEAIAMTGFDDGYYGLYFEIRNKGKHLDPVLWLSDKNPRRGQNIQ